MTLSRSDDLSERFATSARALLPPPASHIVIAVSGGADSVALLHLLRAMGLWTLTVYHLDHGLRPTSADEAQWLVDLCQRLGVPVIQERCAIDVLAEEQQRGVEETGRRERYRRLRSAAERIAAQAILTAHHLNDQAETILMNLLRGAGRRGGRGLPAARSLDGIPLLRPLLDITRDELKDYLRERGLAWVEDASNDDQRYRRNHIRITVLPRLEAAVAGFTTALLDWSSRLPAMIADEPTGRSGPIAPGIGAVCVHSVHERGEHWRDVLVAHGITPTRALIRRLDGLALGAAGQQLDIGRFRIERRNDYLHWMPQAPSFGEPAMPSDAVLIATPGTYGRCGEHLLMVHQAAPLSPWTPPGEAWLDEQALRWPLSWRVVSPQDVWRPLGTAGGQRVCKYLADRKCDHVARQLIGVIADADGVVWVPGFGIAERVRLGATTRYAIHGWWSGHAPSPARGAPQNGP